MPAVTVEDTTTLARVPAPAPGTVRRRVRSVTTAPSGFEGEGFPVRPTFAGVDLRDPDPFIHMDQMDEVEDGVSFKVKIGSKAPTRTTRRRRTGCWRPTGTAAPASAIRRGALLRRVRPADLQPHPGKQWTPQATGWGEHPWTHRAG